MRFVDVRGTRLSAVGLGTWQFGSKDWGYGSDYADVEAGRILQRALDLGVNVIDTAEVYGRGNSERIVGRALGDRRKEAFIATKVLPIAPTAGYVESTGARARERLGIDVIDLYQIHWPNPVVPISQQMEGMRRLQQCGRRSPMSASATSHSRAGAPPKPRSARPCSRTRCSTASSRASPTPSWFRTRRRTTGS